MAASMTVTAGVLAEVEAHAREAEPWECCGLLVGTDERILAAVRARNAAGSATRYLVDPADHFAAIRFARARGLDVIGAYHSHPAGPPVPSPRDIAESPAPAFLHLLVAKGPEGQWSCRLFRLPDGNIVELRLVTIGEESAS